MKAIINDIGAAAAKAICQSKWRELLD